jgi:hypothetical protein
MKMPAGFLLGGAAGVKDAESLCGRQAGEFKFLECSGWRGGDLRPIRNRQRRGAARFADFAIGWIRGELKSEQFRRKVSEVDGPGGGAGIGDELTQLRGKTGEVGLHAVFSLHFRLVFRHSQRVECSWAVGGCKLEVRDRRGFGMRSNRTPATKVAAWRN